MEVVSDKLVVTAVKKAEDRDSLIVRFFNIRETNAHDAIIRVPEAQTARTVNLNEDPGKDLLIHQDGSLNIDVPAKKIATVEFQLE